MGGGGGVVNSCEHSAMPSRTSYAPECPWGSRNSTALIPLATDKLTSAWLDELLVAIDGATSEVEPAGNLCLICARQAYPLLLFSF